jgi:hypothetical protein
MIDDVTRLGLRDLGVAQGRTTTLGKCFPTATTASQAQLVMAVRLAHDEMPLADLAKGLACSVDTSSSVQVGSLHDVLLLGTHVIENLIRPDNFCQPPLRLSQPTTAGLIRGVCRKAVRCSLDRDDCGPRAYRQALF